MIRQCGATVCIRMLGNTVKIFRQAILTLYVFEIKNGSNISVLSVILSKAAYSLYHSTSNLLII